MSVFYIAQWSVRPADAAACEAALAVIGDHIQKSHPGIQSVQVYRQVWEAFYPPRLIMDRRIHQPVRHGSGARNPGVRRDLETSRADGRGRHLPVQRVERSQPLHLV